MDNQPDPLTDLERRLAALAPARDGLDADALLFAAGRASARPGARRFVWPAVAACLALVATGLAVQLAGERSERLALAERLQQAAQQLARQAPAATRAGEPASTEQVAPDSLLASHRVIERGLDNFGVARELPSRGAATSDASILRVRPAKGWPDL
jgi:hypothetical protein